MSTKSHILITGAPGVGKTTLTKKLSEYFSAKNIKAAGFYTEERRDASNRRLGFDVVSLNSCTRETLARTESTLNPTELTKYRVGQYVVFPDKFEKISLPIFQETSEVLIVDEIGKMELFSRRFEELVREAFTSRRVIATVPVKGGRVVEAIKGRQDCRMFVVDRNNRNVVFGEIVKFFEENK